jgi:hypothetical protein
MICSTAILRAGVQDDGEKARKVKSSRMKAITTDAIIIAGDKERLGGRAVRNFFIR